MSKYLRDETIKNLTLNDERLKKLNEEIVQIVNTANNGLQENDKNWLFVSYVIRFEANGYRLMNFDEVLKYFKEASSVTRIIFVVECVNSIGKLMGKSLELRFDSRDINSNNLVVQDDDKVWVDCTYLKIKETLEKCGNRHYLVRNRWVVLFIQLTGVVFGFLMSLIVAIKIAPFFKIESPLLFSFIMSFLLFSNIWTLILEYIYRLIDYLTPNISFQKISINRAIKDIGVGLAGAFLLYIIVRFFAYFYDIVRPLFK